MLTVTGVVKSFGALRILDGVSLELARGATLALLGDSGSGKSTLLHLIAGLDAPDQGSITLEGAEIAGQSDACRARMRREKIGIVFQQYNLVQSLTVAGNVALHARLAGRHDPEHIAHVTERLRLDGLERRYPEQVSGGQQQRVAGLSRREARERARQLLAMVGLGERETHRPARLSGGEQQRVAIVRAIANVPNVLLADEPTGNLDERTGDRVLDLMLELVAEAGMSLIMVTHSERLAARLDRTRRLHAGRLD